MAEFPVTTAPSPLVDQFPKLADFAGQARKEGYADPEIDDFVRQKINTARKAGHSFEDINSFLGVEQPTTIEKLIAGPVGKSIESVLGVARQIGGAPEPATPQGLIESYKQSKQQLEPTMREIFGAAGEPIATGISGLRAGAGAVSGPFIPRFIQEGVGAATELAGKGVGAVARRLGLPEPIVKAGEQLTPDVLSALLFAKGAQAIPRGLNAPVSNLFAPKETPIPVPPPMEPAMGKPPPLREQIGIPPPPQRLALPSPEPAPAIPRPDLSPQGLARMQLEQNLASEGINAEAFLQSKAPRPGTTQGQRLTLEVGEDGTLKLIPGATGAPKAEPPPPPALPPPQRPKIVMGQSGYRGAPETPAPPMREPGPAGEEYGFKPNRTVLRPTGGERPAVSGGLSATVPTNKSAAEMTYKELRTALNPSNKAELERARPLYREIFPQWTETAEPNAANDFAYGIWRAANKGDEIPRVPTVDLSTRHKSLIQTAISEGREVPPKVLADYPDLPTPPKPQPTIQDLIAKADEASKKKFEKLGIGQRKQAGRVIPEEPPVEIAPQRSKEGISNARIRNETLDKVDVKSPAETYDTALEQFRQESKKFTKTRDAYRKKEVGDAEYLAARKEFDRQQAIFDDVETEFINKTNAAAKIQKETPQVAPEAAAEQEAISTRLRATKARESQFDLESKWQRLMQAKREDVPKIASTLTPEERTTFLNRLDAAPGDNPVVRAALQPETPPQATFTRQAIPEAQPPPEVKEPPAPTYGTFSSAQVRASRFVPEGERFRASKLAPDYASNEEFMGLVQTSKDPTEIKMLRREWKGRVEARGGRDNELEQIGNELTDKELQLGLRGTGPSKPALPTDEQGQRLVNIGKQPRTPLDILKGETGAVKEAVPPVRGGAPEFPFERSVQGVAKELRDTAAVMEDLNARAKETVPRAEEVAAGGTFAEKPVRELFRERTGVKPETYGYKISQADVEKGQAQVVATGRRLQELLRDFEQRGDPLDQNIARLANERLDKAIAEANRSADLFKKQRFAAGRTVQQYNRAPVPKDIIDTFKDLGVVIDGLQAAKERLPIYTNILESLKKIDRLTPVERKQLMRDFVDAFRLNLFATTSWTLDFVGNATELGAQAAGGLGRDLVHAAKGDVTFPSIQGIIRTIRDRKPLPQDVTQGLGLGTSIAGEKIRGGFGSKQGTFTKRETIPSAALDYLVGTPLYLKSVADSGAKRLGASVTMWRDAIEAADRAGVTGSERQAFFKDYWQHPPEQAIKNAVGEGQKAGYDRVLTKWEEGVGRSTSARLLVDAFARWPFQFSRWAGEMLGYNRDLFSKVKAGTATAEDVGGYLAKTATGWGGLMLLDQTLYDHVDFNSMEYVHSNGDRTRLSGRDPIPTALFALAVIHGDVDKATAALQHASIPFAKVLAGQGGLLGNLISQTASAVKRGDVDPKALRRETLDTLNRAIPGQAVLSAVKTVFDPTIREGVGANIPGVSKLLPAAVNPTTGEPLEPRQSILGLELPSVGGTPIPGARRILDPATQMLSKYGLMVYRGPRSTIAGYPAGEVPPDVDREWRQQFGKVRADRLGELMPTIAKIEGVADPGDLKPGGEAYELIRKEIQKSDATSAKIATAIVNGERGAPPTPKTREPTIRERRAPTLESLGLR